MTLRTIGGRVGQPERGGDYRFSGRTLSAPAASRGLYSTVVGFGLLIEPVIAPPDMHRAKLLQEGGGGLLQE